MNATIHIDRLRFSTIVGVHEWERHVPQDLVVSLWLRLDRDEAAPEDDLSATLDYDAFSQRVIRQVRGAKRKTIEAVSDDLLRLCLEQARVEHAHVRVEKPGALSTAESVAVTLDGFRETD